MNGRCLRCVNVWGHFLYKLEKHTESTEIIIFFTDRAVIEKSCCRAGRIYDRKEE